MAKKKFKLNISRIVWPSDPPLIAVLIPWEHFQRDIGITAYSQQISRAGGIPIAVSVSPEGKTYSHSGSLERVWEKACEQTPPDKLKWQEEEFEGDHAPWEVFK